MMAAMSTLLCLAALFCLAAPAGASEVAGQVTIKSALAPRAVGRKKVGGGYGSEAGGSQGGPTAEVDERSYVVVYLEPTRGTLKATPGQAVIAQKNKDFVPHVLPVVKGSTVVFTNEDITLHHIYSTSSTRPFEIPKYPRGQRKSITVDRLGVVEIFCGLHPRMNAYILVLSNDYFTMAGADGSFTLKNVPPGTYTLKAWHPRVKEISSQTITVPASGKATVNVSL
jgi:plastocyanin